MPVPTCLTAGRGTSAMSAFSPGVGGKSGWEASSSLETNNL